MQEYAEQGDLWEVSRRQPCRTLPEAIAAQVMLQATMAVRSCFRSARVPTPYDRAALRIRRPLARRCALATRPGSPTAISRRDRERCRPRNSTTAQRHNSGSPHRRGAAGGAQPENVVVFANGLVKLADFGLAIDVRDARPVSRVGCADDATPAAQRPTRPEPLRPQG